METDDRKDTAEGHVEPDDLAMLALGVEPGGATAAHLTQCRRCAEDLTLLREIVTVGRATTPEDIPTAPPARVWEHIQAELGLAADAPSADGGAEPQPALGLVENDNAEAEPASAPAEVTVLRPRSRRITGWLAAAASVGVVAGAVGGALWASNRTPTDPEPVVLAMADLEPLPGWDARGVASVQQTAEGTRLVVVEVDGEFGSDGFREVWLLAPDLSGMVSIGLLEGSFGEFALPEEIDLTRYSVVDVSEEPFDGDATHSGNSIVRGAVEA